MRWVKRHGADYYDWRTIPDVLKPGEELYGVYEFKRGFGGFVRRVIPTQDLSCARQSTTPTSARSRCAATSDAGSAARSSDGVRAATRGRRRNQRQRRKPRPRQD